MNEKISRNDACPCGSGKKYKKCCGLKEVASITTIIEQEIEDLQHQLVSYALHHFGTELEEDFEDLIEAITISGEDEENFYLLTHTIWFSAFVPLEDGETILEKFIREEAKKTKRPKTKDILQSWTNGARTIAGKVLHSEANTFVFEDMLTGESQEGVIVTKVPDIEDGEFFTGILLPYEQRYVFFPIPYVLGHLNPQAYIVESAGNFGYESPQEFLNEHFMEMINELPAIGVSVQPDDLDWPAPIHKETAVLFKKMSEAAEEPADITEYGIMMWYHFCKATQKRIQNPAVYAAAIHYLAYNSTLDSQVTQKQIGERYGIAPNRISTISNDILDVLEQELEDPAPAIPSIQQRSPQSASPLAAEQELQKLMGELNQNDFKNLDEVNAFINSRLNTPQNNVKNAPQNKKEEAQDLIYQAFETNGKKRYKLAEEALQLNPNNADAYNILAEKATSLEEASHLYKTGMEVGIKDLGKAFLLKNKGHFWGLIETRPFMRAKKNYADSLIQLGKPKEAIREYEELLTLNPNDSQGVRDDLFIAYVDQGDLKNAKRLLEMYKEETTQGFLNGVLLEVLQNGFTAKATTLLKKVKKQNKFVLAYLTGQKKIPKNLPEYYGWGDENEAIIYAHAHQHLWGRVDGIVEWLKK